MSILYNCRHDGDQYRITKFDEYMNPQGSYLTDGEACECPAGVRPTCRHRQMLPKFLQREAIGTSWFYDYDRGGWVQMGDEWAQQEPLDELDIAEMPDGVEKDELTVATMIELPPDANVAEEFAKLLSDLPEGVQILSLDDPAVVHNAIAEAVGEPPAPTHIKRRF